MLKRGTLHGRIGVVPTKIRSGLVVEGGWLRVEGGCECSSNKIVLSFVNGIKSAFVLLIYE